MTTKLEFTIKNGPSAEMLFFALRLRHEGRRVGFALVGDDLNILINSIEIEDGSGDRWIIKGYDPNKVMGVEYVHGFYDTRTRSGFLRLGLPADG